ncbi:hypothetical protein [Natrinema salinisoli]|uniref:hypothetical protein n=1 Tax=Natrinema salinisoli TaxID=2878535 RepID=UPI001CF0CA67|nr:hypothetical protein [Natrinema salinisoli]
MAGLGAIDPGELDVRCSPPYGAHPLLYEAVDDVLGPRFRQGPNGEPADKRRDDYLLGAALFIDVPADERDKTRMYFAASMIAQAPNRDVNTQLAPVNNYRAMFDEEAVEESNEFDTKIDVVEEAFREIEREIEGRLEEADADRSEVVTETLDGVRSGQSFFARWGNAREELKDQARDQGRGKYGF